MTRSTLAVFVLVASALAAHAEPVAPSDVVFEGGSVAQSLTGVAGDPAAGRETMIDRGLGNCVACHASSALADVPWPGEIGPSLDGTGSRWSEAELRGIVANAKMTFDGSMMPSFYKVSGFVRPGKDYTGKAIAEEEIVPILSAQQVEDVVAYLMTMQDQ